MNYPSRWDWRPKQKPVEPGVTFRQAEPWDVVQLRRFARAHCNRTAPAHLWTRWISESGYVAQVAVRNNFNIVGVIVGRFDAGRPNRVLLYGVAPGWMQEREKVLLKLMCLICYEVPENPTEIVVADDDLQTQTLLRKCGVVPVERARGEAEHHVFRYPPGIALRAGNVAETE